MVRKRVYIGEAEENAIYYDYDNNVPLSVKKSKLLNTYKTRKSWKYIGFILGTIFLIRGIGFLVPEVSFFNNRYTISTIIFLALLWVIECSFFSVITYQALYKNVNLAQPTNKKMLSKAINSNNLWNIFSTKKVTVSKKIGMAILIIAIVLLTIGIFPMLYMINVQGGLLGNNIGGEIIPLSLLGFLPYTSILLIWINNPLRWLNIVEKENNRRKK
ncbi:MULTISPECIES: hypothetical protein [Lactococcus]|uniref:hypothetical protein n=1 Tax=Lactococcus TaxID=1357 RepID=UPI001F57039E|nr:MULTISPECIES: hypothetical protein [Lactococcus]